jgi:hypothetical protein
MRAFFLFSKWKKYGKRGKLEKERGKKGYFLSSNGKYGKRG